MAYLGCKLSNWYGSSVNGSFGGGSLVGGEDESLSFELLLEGRDVDVVDNECDECDECDGCWPSDNNGR